jgi:hypothetical protein
MLDPEGVAEIQSSTFCDPFRQRREGFQNVKIHGFVRERPKSGSLALPIFRTA